MIFDQIQLQSFHFHFFQSPTTSPSQLYGLFSYSLSPVHVARMLMVIGPSTGAWETYVGLHSQRKQDLTAALANGFNETERRTYQTFYKAIISPVHIPDRYKTQLQKEISDEYCYVNSQQMIERIQKKEPVFTAGGGAN